MGSIGLSHIPQICVGASRKAGVQVPITSAPRDDRLSDQDAYLSVLLSYTGGAHTLPYSLNFMCPHPVLIPTQFVTELEHFHVALARALTNIVQRWYADKEADFPSRMPLESREEQLLQWIYQCSEDNTFPAYEGHQGNWRPDLLLPADDPEGFKICEINARFASNGIDLNAWIYRSLEKLGPNPRWLDIAADPGQMLDRYFDLFDPALPIHLVRVREETPLVESFIDFAEERTRMRPRIVAPADLRLVPDATSPTGYALHCTRDSESLPSRDVQNAGLERIYQVRLQLFLDEFASLSSEIQQHLALCSAQDIRTMLLIHDKRILGILLQELDDLVIKHHVLVKEQADLLRKRMIPTAIPGSKELQQIVNMYYQGKVSKDEFIIKPIRSGRGEGVKYGEDLAVSDRALYVLQPVIDQAETEMFLDEEMKVQRCRLVGTYHSVHGDFTALGAWRIGMSNDRTTNMANGRAWKLGSMVLNKD
ncbi:uncharacterized protein P174DRAFT_458698 [Aspergillus novofumigatus IBT 16806]|uniref:Uncharacterized protein n=1 Tax=Aspergillus novofumigatus (strain IBT 16806) TaxID=1392255 RepID=A0A2I1CBU5_ASPN1|nr:uncharacterized protein P174DRAFT_458698 [Aspergillus novofumigatus IBT 16806]PKX95109.1 hypothetical protein P174DRAFT_458698 [Aspergillus novofumigatus IBT 16806]